MFTKIERYIFLEVLKIVIVALIVFVGIFLIAGAFQFATRGISITEFLRVIPFATLTTLAYTVPVALLTGITLGYGRLVDELEVTGMRASGMSFFSITKPLYIFALILSVGAYFFCGDVLPDALYRKNMVADACAARLLSLKEGKNETFEIRDRNGDRYHVLCRSYSGRHLKGILIHKSNIAQPIEILATSGEILLYPEKNTIQIELQDVTVTFYGTDKRMSCDVLTCEKYTIRIPVTTLPHDRPKFYPNKKLFELISKESAEMSSISIKISDNSLPTEERKKMSDVHRWHAKRVSNMSEELFSRFALATYPFLFAVVSLPIPVIAGRWRRYGAFLVAMLICLFCGFFPLIFFQTLIDKGFLSLWSAFALSTILLIIPAFYLNLRLSRT